MCAVSKVLIPRSRLPRQRRQKRRTPWRKLLINGVQHETYSEVFPHYCHDLDRMLPREMVHHLSPKFTADSVFAKQRAPEAISVASLSDSPAQLLSYLTTSMT